MVRQYKRESYDHNVQSEMVAIDMNSEVKNMDSVHNRNEIIFLTFYLAAAVAGKMSESHISCLSRTNTIIFVLFC